MITIYNWEIDKPLKDQIANLIVQNKLIPVIGSGFTRNCKALKGKVPSGEDMSSYLKDLPQKLMAKTKSITRIQVSQNYARTIIKEVLQKNDSNIFLHILRMLNYLQNKLSF